MCIPSSQCACLQDSSLLGTSGRLSSFSLASVSSTLAFTIAFCRARKNAGSMTCGITTWKCVRDLYVGALSHANAHSTKDYMHCTVPLLLAQQLFGLRDNL